MFKRFAPTSALEVASSLSVAVGAGWVYRPAGLIVAGLFGLAFARAASR